MRRLLTWSKKILPIILSALLSAGLLLLVVWIFFPHLLDGRGSHRVPELDRHRLRRPHLRIFN